MQHNLKNLPCCPLPNNYHFRLFSSPLDKKRWAAILAKTGEYANETKALERFRSEFSPYMDQVQSSVLFLETSEGTTVGTATAWYKLWEGQSIGRLHWVEILPEYQGRGLGRPLITKAMHLLQIYHDKAYLKTQETSEAAIHLYKKLGWIPCMQTKKEKEIWKRLN